MRDFMITSDNFKSLTKSQQQRDDDRGFTYVIQCQIWLDEMFSVTRTYDTMMNLYLKISSIQYKIKSLLPTLCTRELPINISNSTWTSHYCYLWWLLCKYIKNIGTIKEIQKAAFSLKGNVNSTEWYSFYSIGYV